MSKRHQVLLAWAKSASNEQIAKTKTSRAYLLQIGYGNKKASAELASRIESATNGQVSRKHLRPEDWREIWPELSA